MLSTNLRTHPSGFIRALARLHKVLHVPDEVRHGRARRSRVDDELLAAPLCTLSTLGPQTNYLQL